MYSTWDVNSSKNVCISKYKHQQKILGIISFYSYCCCLFELIYSLIHFVLTKKHRMHVNTMLNYSFEFSGFIQYLPL